MSFRPSFLDELSSAISKYESEIKELSELIESLEEELGATRKISEAHEIRKQIQEKKSESHQLKVLVFDLKIRKTQHEFSIKDAISKNFLAIFSISASVALTLILIWLTQKQIKIFEDQLTISAVDMLIARREMSDQTRELVGVCGPIIKEHALASEKIRYESIQSEIRKIDEKTDRLMGSSVRDIDIKIENLKKKIETPSGRN